MKCNRFLSLVVSRPRFACIEIITQHESESNEEIEVVVDGETKSSIFIPQESKHHRNISLCSVNKLQKTLIIFKLGEINELEIFSEMVKDLILHSHSLCNACARRKTRYFSIAQKNSLIHVTFHYLHSPCTDKLLLSVCVILRYWNSRLLSKLSNPSSLLIRVVLARKAIVCRDEIALFLIAGSHRAQDEQCSKAILGSGMEWRRIKIQFKIFQHAQNVLSFHSLLALRFACFAEIFTVGFFGDILFSIVRVA